MDSLLDVTKFTVADAVDVESARLVAVMVAEEALLEAVNNPWFEIVPPIADQVTPTLLVPATLAVNCTTPVGEMRAVAGEMLMAMAGVAAGFCVLWFEPKSDAQDETHSVDDNTRIIWRISGLAIRQLRSTALRAANWDMSVSSNRYWGLTFEPDRTVREQMNAR
jgi:hypothetical protein